jgi:1-deoxy-D-xylulose-5-phosphate reductoisomerase
VTTTVSLVGSTGSIGTQAIDVLEETSLSDPGRFQLVAIGANRSVDALADQAARLRPQVVAVADESLAGDLRSRVPPGVEVLAGAGSLAEIARMADVVLNAVVGFAGLPVTLAALAEGRRLALANKESLVAGAPVVARVRSTPGAEMLPVDSEHCAIHQCLRAGRSTSEVSRIVLTASGGPFRGLSREALAEVCVDDALKHPTWNMGPKITVDSSTLMNKGLEVIEAHELFGVEYERIDVVVHPQSIVHSMVEFVDGAVVAQLSEPDMRLPISYCLSYPERLSLATRPGYGSMDWSRPFELNFEAPDTTLFRCLGLAYSAGRTGGLAPAWLNAANEVAVSAFLEGRIRWLSIAQVVEEVLAKFPGGSATTVEEVIDADARARKVASDAVDNLSAAFSGA